MGGDVPIPIGSDGTLAKPRRRSAKDPIHGAFNIAVGIVLLPTPSVQRVLVRVESTGVIALSITAGSDGDSLGAFAVGVAEVDVVGLEVGGLDVEDSGFIETTGGSGVDVAGEGH